ncbi:hypothetical protein [Leptospira sp. 'Mane']|uniref:hypothetical protein n=1 Tax=Leptospira sp. 'Mane' TaxID=3387407 RepID=UPI00398AC459
MMSIGLLVEMPAFIGRFSGFLIAAAMPQLGQFAFVFSMNLLDLCPFLFTNYSYAVEKI